MHGHRSGVRCRATVPRFDGLLKAWVGAFHRRYITTFYPLRPVLRPASRGVHSSNKIWLHERVLPPKAGNTIHPNARNSLGFK
jgi:hypothetical protein